MKYFLDLLILTFLMIATHAKAQYIIAGTQGVIYVDIIPDTSVSVVCSPGSYNTTYGIDINQDAINDLRVTAYCNTSGTSQIGVAILSLDAATSFSFGSIDSTAFNGNGSCVGWNTRTILKKINNGDTIKNSNYVSSGYLAYYNYDPCVFAYSNQWVDSIDHFLGVRYKTSIDTLYGWVKINVSNYSVSLIKEFSLGLSTIGIQTNIGINNSISIYPNPTSNTILLNINNDFNSQNSIITIQNTLGQIVKKISFTKDINVSDLAEGCYFLQVILQNGEIYKTKFIKQ